MITTEEYKKMTEDEVAHLYALQHEYRPLIYALSVDRTAKVELHRILDCCTTEDDFKMFKDIIDKANDVMSKVYNDRHSTDEAQHNEVRERSFDDEDYDSFF